MAISRGEQDYIRVVYELYRRQADELTPAAEKDIYIPNHSLIEALNHTAQTVNEMVKRLDKKKILTYLPYKGSRLTKKGVEEALSLIRVHRLWELFLVEKMGFTWEQVHKEAHLLEHATSPFLEERLYHYLGNPLYCPHGNPIPNLKGHFPERESQPLTRALVKRNYIIKRVRDEEPLLHYLNNKGICLETRIQIDEIDSISENIVVSLLDNDKRQVVIGFTIAQKIFVQQC